MVRFARFISIVLLAAGCQSSPTTPTENPVPLTVTRFAGFPQPLAEYSGLTQPARTIVRDGATWQATWAEIFRNQAPIPQLPAVDFTREIVVVAAMGERRTGGHGIFIEGATEVSTGVTVQLRSVSPDSSCIVTLALTQPVDAVRLPRRDTVVFAERATVTQCR